MNFKPWVLILLIALKALAKFLLGEKGESKSIGTLRSVIWDYSDRKKIDGKVLEYIEVAIALLILRVIARLVQLMVYIAT